MDWTSITAENNLRCFVNQNVELDTTTFGQFVRSSEKTAGENGDAEAQSVNDLAEQPQLVAKTNPEVATVICSLLRCVLENNKDRPNTRMLFRLAVTLFLNGELSPRHLVHFAAGYCAGRRFKPDVKLRYMRILERFSPHQVGAPYPDHVQAMAHTRRLMADNHDLFASKRMTVGAVKQMASLATQLKFPHGLDVMFMSVGKMVAMGYATPQDLIDIPTHVQIGFRFTAAYQEYIRGDMFRPAPEAVAVQAAVVALSSIEDKKEAVEAACAAYAQAMLPK